MSTSNPNCQSTGNSTACGIEIGEIVKVENPLTVPEVDPCETVCKQGENQTSHATGSSNALGIEIGQVSTVENPLTVLKVDILHKHGENPASQFTGSSNSLGIETVSENQQTVNTFGPLTVQSCVQCPLFACKNACMPDDDSSFICPVCHKYFPTKKSLARHKKLAKPEFRKQHLCTLCGRFFDEEQVLKKHLETRHEKREIRECDICGKVFDEKIFFECHRLTHFEQKPLRCDFCGDVFTSETTFKRHRSGHKAKTNEVAKRFLSMKEVLKQKLEDSKKQS